jgi:hypothetical protein
MGDAAYLESSGLGAYVRGLCADIARHQPAAPLDYILEQCVQILRHPVARRSDSLSASLLCSLEREIAGEGPLPRLAASLRVCGGSTETVATVYSALAAEGSGGSSPRSAQLRQLVRLLLLGAVHDAGQVVVDSVLAVLCPRPPSDPVQFGEFYAAVRACLAFEGGVGLLLHRPAAQLRVQPAQPAPIPRKIGLFLHVRSAFRAMSFQQQHRALAGAPETIPPEWLRVHEVVAALRAAEAATVPAAAPPPLPSSAAMAVAAAPAPFPVAAFASRLSAAAGRGGLASPSRRPPDAVTFSQFASAFFECALAASAEELAGREPPHSSYSLRHE